MASLVGVVSSAELDRADRALRDDEFAAVLRDRELAAMRAADLESHVAQRCFLFNMMTPGHEALSFERMYTMRHNALLDAHALLGRVRRLLHQQRLSRAVAVLNDEMGSEDEPEASEEESSDDDPVVDADTAETMAESLLARVSPAGWQPFSGRGSRLD